MTTDTPTLVPSRQATEHAFSASDGAELFYRMWPASAPTDKALVLFHRGHEHSGRWQDTVDQLRLDDVTIFAWDARGHGRSPGERGSAESLARVIKDIDEYVRHLTTAHGFAAENMIVLGHSVGAVTLAAWVHDYAPQVRAMILATPAFRVKLYVPLAIPLLRLKQRILGPGYVKSYVKATMLTHDRTQARLYQDDEAIFRQIAVNILLDLYDTSTRLLDDAGAIQVPTLMLGAGADWVVSLPAQQQFFDRLSSRIKRMEVLPGMYHAVFHERDRYLVVDKVRDFVRERFERPVASESLVEADKYGYTRAEYDRLNAPGSRWYAIVRANMRTVGRLSRGVRLGWQAGFDSGVTLDYVYENRPQGALLIGKWIDKSYLNSLGWRGIRQRRVHMQRLLRRAIETTHESGRPVHVLDIAAGPGRYVLETIKECSHLPITAVLRDYKEENLQAARRLTAELNLAQVTITHGDAFDRASLAAISPRPTIGIVSGLYELFPANAPVMESLRGLADGIPPGGLLIYTNQPWHPQVEFIARVLRNREGKPWIMRRRTQAEMDELVRRAGFEKLTQEIDTWGIFTVSLARRIDR